MQDYLTTRYRQVHEKIKESIVDIKAKLRDFPAPSLIGKDKSKISRALTNKIQDQLAHAYNGRLLLFVKYWTIAAFISLPILYNARQLTTVPDNGKMAKQQDVVEETKQRNFQVNAQSDFAKSKSSMD